MTRLLSQPSSAVRGLGTLPDIQQATEPPEVRVPELQPQSMVGRLRSAQIDAAIEVNRYNTPAEAREQRSAPRYSIRETNDLSLEEIQDRLSKISPSDDRPGWVKTLDIIDMPRNFMAGILTEHVLPEAKRMAMLRGEFDQAGLPKVYGSDMLRAMGIENRVVNAIGGFAVDIFTDPLSYIGGPAGGLKTAGSRGLIEATTTGRRTLNSAINAVRKGGAVSNSYARQMIDDTLAHGVAAKELDVAADAATKATYLRDTLFGTSGKVSNAAERVGLGRSTRGGALANDFYRVATDTTTPTEAARIKSVKDFVSRYSDNPGLNLTGGKGGAVIGHIPGTTLSLTVPSFKLPGIGRRFGQQAEIQKVVAQATTGRAQSANVIASAVSHSNKVSDIATELQDLGDQIGLLSRSDPQSPTLISARERVDELRTELADVIREGGARRASYPQGLHQLDGINDIPTLLATMDMVEDAHLAARVAESQIKFTDATGAAIQATRGDVENARNFRQELYEEARAQKLVSGYEEFADALTDPQRQSAALSKMISLRQQQSAKRWTELIDLPDEQLAIKEQVADALSESMSAAYEISNLRGIGVSRAMGSDQRLLAEASRMMLGLSDRDLGFLPLTKFDDIARAMGKSGLAARINLLGDRIATNLGGVKGLQAESMRAARSHITGSKQIAGDVASRYARNIEQLIRKSSTATVSDFDTVNKLAGLALEQEMIRRAALEFPEIADQMRRGTQWARQTLAEATASGVMRDEALRNGVGKLVNQFADEIQEYGRQAVLAGDFDNPLSVYVPVLLKSEAAKRAAIARSRGHERAAEIISDLAGPGKLDPTKRRVTNFVEYTDASGNPGKFTIAEAMAYASVNEGRLANMSRQEFQNYQRVTEGIEAVRKQTGTKATGDKLRDFLQERSRPAAGSELNQYADEGYLDPIVGGVLRSGQSAHEFFDTGLVNMVYARSHAHEIARAKDSLRDLVEPFVIGDIKANDMAKTTYGETAVLSDGRTGMYLGDGRIRVGNRNYVRLGHVTGKFPDDTLFNPSTMLRGELDDAMIPDTLAAELTRLADTLQPDKANEVMLAAEKITSLFRTSTLLHSSWMATNVIGNTLLAAMMGMFSDPKRGAQYLRYMTQAARMHMRRNADQVATTGRLGVGRAVNAAGVKLGMNPESTVMVGGGPMRAGNVIDEVEQLGVSGGRSRDAVEQMIRLYEREFQSLTDDVAGSNPVSIARREYDAAQAARKKSTRLQKTTDAVSAATTAVPVRGYKKLVRAWFGANAMIDDTFRTAAYMMMRNDGMDPVTAAAEVRRGMLNFGDLTSFEANTLRPLIPFYSWLRASMPAFVSKGIRDPKVLSAVPKIQTGMEELFAGEERLPRHMRPRWIQETMGIQLGTDPNSRSALLLGTLLPQEQALQAATGVLGGLSIALPGDTGILDFDGRDFMDGAQWLFSQASPAVRVPVELAAGREIFSRRDIGTRPGEGELTLNDYLLNQIRPLKEYGLGVRTGKTTEAFSRSVGEGVGRALIGGRLQPSLQEDRRTTALFFELKDIEAEMRKAVRLAENQGDDERVTKLKFRLLGEYQKYLQRGGDPTGVPAWARDDLAAFSQTG